MKRLAAAAVGCAAALLVLELGCRLFIPRLSFDKLKTRNWPNPGIFQASDDLPFELAPGISHYTNALGMRDKERTLKKPKGVVRIVFLGDSITMYGGFTELLEERLGQSFPGLFEVWNCSIGGHGIREYAIQMSKRVPAYKPDLVVVAFCLNDLAATPVMYYDVKGKLNCYLPLPGIPTALEFWLYKRSFAYRRWLEVLVRLRPALQEPASVAMGEKALAVMEKQAARMGVPLRAVVFPWLKPEAEWTAGERDGYEKITALLKNHRVPYLDLSKTFPPGGRLALRRTPDDFIHINAAGDRLAADALHGFLREQGFVPANGRATAR